MLELNGPGLEVEGSVYIVVLICGLVVRCRMLTMYARWRVVFDNPKDEERQKSPIVGKRGHAEKCTNQVPSLVASSKFASVSWNNGGTSSPLNTEGSSGSRPRFARFSASCDEPESEGEASVDAARSGRDHPSQEIFILMGDTKSWCRATIQKESDGVYVVSGVDIVI